MGDMGTYCWECAERDLRCVCVSVQGSLHRGTCTGWVLHAQSKVLCQHCLLCTWRLTREARRDILLRGLGNSGLSICSFCKNSGGRRMSMGRERRLLTSCREGQESR